MIYLFNKFKQSEEITPDDLKHLNNFYKENKKIHQEIFNTEIKSKKSREIILSEEKPNNNDDQENENNDEENKDKLNNNILLNKSKIFEKELRENNNILSRKSIGRVSLTDTYKKNLGLGNKKYPKIKIIDKEKDSKNIYDIPKNLEKSNVSENEKNNISLYSLKDNKNISDSNDKISSDGHLIKENYEDDQLEKDENKEKKYEMSKSQLKVLELKEMINNTNNIINDVDLKFKQESSKINDKYHNNNENLNNNKINEEKEKDEVIDLEDIQLEKNEEDIKKNIENGSNMNINEEIEKKNYEKTEQINLNNNSYQSSFKEKIIDNTQSHISQKFQYLTITQNTFGLNSLIPKKSFNSLAYCKDIEISILYNILKNKITLSKENDFHIQKNEYNNDKDKLIKEIQTINIDCLENNNDLKNVENKLEILLNKIRIKLGYKSENQNLENILEKYSILLLNKIEKLNKNK
jgi:hypothetical protein